jgi:hypothetical protein
MKKEMQIIREVNIQAENFYEDALQLGQHAAYALKKNHRAQMTGLENIANSALKVSDILDYIKRQTARFPSWRQSFPQPEDADENAKKAFGERLRHYLESTLIGKRNAICKRLNIADKTDEERDWRRRVYLLLIRQFLRQMVIHYEYCVSFESK